MEKRVAHYNLLRIKTLIAQKRYFVTLTARQSYTALGLSDDEVLDIIDQLTPKELYKSMTSYNDHTTWQDVYHANHKELKLYIKLQINEDAIVISFKEK